MAVRTRQSLPLSLKLSSAPTSWKGLGALISLFMVIYMTSVIPSSFLTPADVLNLLPKPSTEPVFSLLVTLQFSAAEHKEQFYKDFQPLANHCKEHEPDTISYEALNSDKDPLQVLILERYRNKETAFLQVHRSSAPFQSFRPKLKAMEDQGYVKISGDSYVDSGIGFGDRS